MILAFDLILLLFVVICAIAALSVKDLLSAVIILGAYSFFMCLLWAEMGAVDVAFTEASVSAGIGTVLFIAAVSKTKRRSSDSTKGLRILTLFTVIITGVILIYGTHDMVDWADPQSPASIHVSPRYIEKTIEETATPNVVTSVLADYRGYDTLGETTVIFTAGVACILILRIRRRQRK